MTVIGMVFLTFVLAAEANLGFFTTTGVGAAFRFFLMVAILKILLRPSKTIYRN